MRKKRITVLIPLHNEELNIKPLYNRLSKLSDNQPNYGFEFLFVNDGSTDKSLLIVQELQNKDERVSYINLSRNFGKEIAMAAGIDYVDSDALVIIDADMQDPPELVPKMIRYWQQGYSDVYAKRRSREGENWFVKFTSSLFYRVFQFLSDTPIQLDTGDFRLFDKRAIESLKQFRENQRYNKGIFSWIGYKKKEILFDRDKRAYGKTSIGFGKRVNLAINAITSFSTKPLRLAMFLGFFISLGAFIYALVLILRKLFFPVDMSGYTSIMAVVLLLGGINLFFIGILGEYLGKVYNEVKKRPLYIIEEYKNGKSKS